MCFDKLLALLSSDVERAGAGEVGIHWRRPDVDTAGPLTDLVVFTQASFRVCIIEAEVIKDKILNRIDLSLQSLDECGRWLLRAFVRFIMQLSEDWKVSPIIIGCVVWLVEWIEQRLSVQPMQTLE